MKEEFVRPTVGDIQVSWSIEYIHVLLLHSVLVLGMPNTSSFSIKEFGYLLCCYIVSVMFTIKVY